MTAVSARRAAALPGAGSQLRGLPATVLLRAW